MIEDPMSEMILRGQVPTGSKVIIEPNDKSSEDINEEESIVDIKVTQPKEIVKVDDMTVELTTSEPDAFLPINLTNLFMASPAQWQKKFDAALGEFDAKDYPSLIPEGQTVNTIAVPAVLDSVLAMVVMVLPKAMVAPALAIVRLKKLVLPLTVCVPLLPLNVTVPVLVMHGDPRQAQFHCRWSG